MQAMKRQARRRLGAETQLNEYEIESFSFLSKIKRRVVCSIRYKTCFFTGGYWKIGVNLIMMSRSRISLMTWPVWASLDLDHVKFFPS